MSVAPESGFEVAPQTLIAAAARSFELTAKTSEIRAAFAGTTGVADESLAEVSAGPGWESFRAAWRGAIDRFVHSQETFAFNTEAAAVRYEDADEHSMPPAPPIAPSPEDIEEAWDEACQPGMLGEVPPECLIA